jgi:hypothetical protein
MVTFGEQQVDRLSGPVFGAGDSVYGLAVSASWIALIV